MLQTPLSLQLLLAHGNDYNPVLGDGLPLTLLALANQPSSTFPTTTAPRPGLLGASEKDPNSLSDQRWGLIVPAGAAGERLCGALKPLLAHRQAQQAEEIRILTVPPNLDGPALDRWIRDEYQSPDIDEEERPGYLLLAGDLESLPLPLQLFLATATEAFVGRVAFQRLDDYEAYSDKVIRAEQDAIRYPMKGLFFHARDASSAISVGEHELLLPCFTNLARKREAGRLHAGLLRIDNRDTGAILAAARLTEPALLFTLSHGLGAPTNGWSSASAQRQRQGALVLAAQPQEILTAAEVTHGTFLPGGIWLLFACFGAGTPQASAYAPWLSELRKFKQYRGSIDAVLRALPKPGEPAFLAALPQAALANPNGPLAIIGHIDLAFTFSFQEANAKNPSRAARFCEAMRMLLNGSRAGVALRKLHKDIARIHNSLLDPWVELAHDPRGESLRRACLRLQREDLRHFVLLGDPAVRLPSAEVV